MQPASPRSDRQTSLAHFGSLSAWWLRSVLAALFLLLVAFGLYGGGGPFVWGHYGYHAGEYSTRARHTLRHHEILPSNSPGWSKPERTSYYLHHPILTHQLVTLTMLVLGQREVTVRAAALLASALAYSLFVSLLRRHWGWWQAVLGGALFVLVPIHVWFAPHIDVGIPGIACMLGFYLGYLDWIQSGRWTAGCGALFCMMMAGLFEWSPYLAAILPGLHALYLGLRRRGRFLAWVLLFIGAGLLPLLLHGAIVWKTAHLAEMRESYQLRSAGPSWAQTWQGISEGAHELFGRPLLWAISAWLFLLILRAFRRRLLPRDLVAVSFAFALVSYTLLLRNGVLIHLYRLLYGGVLSAIAGVEVVAAVYAASGWLWQKRPNLPKLVAASAALLLCGTTAPLSWRALLQSRLWGGVPLLPTYNPELHPRAFLQRVLASTTPADRIYNHASFIIRKDLYFDLDRNVIATPSLTWFLALPAKEHENSVLILMEPLRNPQEQTLLNQLIHRYAVWRVYEYTMVDLRNSTPLLHQEWLLPTPPRSLWQRYWEGPYAHPRIGAIKR